MTAAEVYEARRRAAPRLDRVAFKTTCLAEFCSQRELVAQTGHAVEDWSLGILKELVDNALDACEEAQIAPEIEISVSTETGAISIADNGPGIAPQTIKHILDYRYRVSSREAYCSPTRGAQGNALKTLIAMPFALERSDDDREPRLSARHHVPSRPAAARTHDRSPERTVVL